MSVFALDSKLTFGKHKGLTVRAVSKFNPEYFSWCVANLSWFELSPDAKTHIAPLVRAHNSQMGENMNAWAHGFGREVKSSRERYDSKRIRIEMQEREAAGLNNEDDEEGNYCSNYSDNNEMTEFDADFGGFNSLY